MFGMRTHKLNEMNERRFFCKCSEYHTETLQKEKHCTSIEIKFHSSIQQGTKGKHYLVLRSRIFRTFFYYVSWYLWYIHNIHHSNSVLGRRVKYPARRKCCAKCKNGSTFALFILQMLSAFNIWFERMCMHIKMETMVPHEYCVNAYIYTQNAHKFKSNGKNNLINSRSAFGRFLFHLRMQVANCECTAFYLS